MIASTSEVRVRYAETDMMGIAYHGNYLPKRLSELGTESRGNCAVPTRALSQ